MKFCDKCGNLMIAKREESRVGYFCRKCKIFVPEKNAASTVITEKLRGEEEKVKVMEKGDEYKGYPKTKADCPNCGNNEAYWFLMQTRGGDEPQTKFLCCTNCNYKWREY